MYQYSLGHDLFQPPCLTIVFHFLPTFIWNHSTRTMTSTVSFTFHYNINV